MKTPKPVAKNLSQVITPAKQFDVPNFVFLSSRLIEMYKLADMIRQATPSGSHISRIRRMS